MHDNIIKSSIIAKIVKKTTHTNTSTSKNTKASTIMSTKSTSNTLQLFTVKSPFTTMFIHVAFECSSRSTSERIKVFSITSIIIRIDCNPMFAGHVRRIGIADE